MRLHPRTQTDAGRFTADGGYEHPEMKVRIRPIEKTRSPCGESCTYALPSLTPPIQPPP